MPGNNLVEFRADPDLLGRITSRTREGSAGFAARRDLERYYALLERALPRFSRGEALLIMDACNGIAFDRFTFHLLWAEVAEAISSDGLDRKWGVDGQALVERLRSLHPCEALSVVDAVERAWLAVGYGGGKDPGEILREVGLTEED